MEQLWVSCLNTSFDCLPVKHLCFFFSSVLRLQGGRGFPQASIVQRCNYATFLWWSRKNQGWDFCSPGNRKSERLILSLLHVVTFSMHTHTHTHTHSLCILCSNTSCVVCKAGSAQWKCFCSVNFRTYEVELVTRIGLSFLVFPREPLTAFDAALNHRKWFTISHVKKH